MSLSLNETHKLIKDAARGAGLSWGEADELAQATVWLEVAGLPGCRSALGVLEEAGEATPPVAMHSTSGWTFEATEPGTATNSVLGATCARDIAMSATEPSAPFDPMTIVGVRWPLLGLGAMAKLSPPCVSQMVLRATDATSALFFEATIQPSSVWFRWGEMGGGVEVLQSYDLSVMREQNDTLGPDLRCVWSPDLQCAATSTGLTPDPAALKLLRRYARACLVPATEESRLKGAGAGTVDRD